MGRIFYLADPHFCHENIVKGCARPFPDAASMTEAMLAAWRARVSPDDAVYLLGDLFVRPKHPLSVLTRLTGRLTLIRGNHDDEWLREIDPSDYFENVADEAEILDGGRLVRMCHLPRPDWIPETGYLLHGHLHNSPPRSVSWRAACARPNVLNVGADIAFSAGILAPAVLEDWIRINEDWKADHPL